MADVISVPGIFGDGAVVSGPGYLAGESPEGRTTLEGAPTPAQVMVFYELASGNWQLVRSLQSEPDGTWRVTDLNPDLAFNVVGRLAGRNDVIVSGVQPTRTDVITFSGEFRPTSNFDGVAGRVTLVGGLPPYVAEVIEPLPYGLAPVIDGRLLLIDGTSDDEGARNSVVRVTASNGPHVDVPVQALIGLNAPDNLTATYAEISDWEITLRWEDRCAFEEGFRVYRSTSPMDLDNLPDPCVVLPTDANEYTDADIVSGETYYYRVGATYGAHVKVGDEVQRLAKWTPADLPVPPRIWLDWGTDVTDVSGTASAWASRGSLGGSFAQSTAANRPQIVATGLNGRRMLRFDGSTDSLQASAPILTALNGVDAGWLLVVARKTAADAVPTSRRIAGFETASASGTARAILYWDDATVGGANRVVLGGRRLDNDAYYGAASAEPSYGEWRLIVGMVDYMERSLTLALDGAIDSVTTGAWTGAGNASATNSRTANIGGGASPGSNFAGDIACVLASSGKISAEDRQHLEGWAAWECGLIDQLPADHPYKTLPP